MKDTGEKNLEEFPTPQYVCMYLSIYYLLILHSHLPGGKSTLHLHCTSFTQGRTVP